MRISVMVMPQATDSLDAVIASIGQAADIGVNEFVAGPFGDPETRIHTMALLTSLTR